MPRDGPSLCVYSLLPLCAAWVMGSQFSGRVGESVELPCRAEGATEGRKGVSWTQVVDGEEKSLLSAHVDVGGMSHRRFTLAQSSVLHLLIHNVSVGDDGLYVCVDGNGTRQATWLSVMNRTDFEHSEGMGTSWTCEGLEMQRGNDTRTLSLPPGDSAILSCSSDASPPFRWMWGCRGCRERGCLQLFDQVRLLPGYGLRIGRVGPYLVLPNLGLQDSGRYVCSVDGLEYRMDLLVRDTGVLDMLIKLWIPVVTVSLSLLLYTLSLALGLALRRRKQRAAHHMRMARLISSFFRRNRNQEYQVDSGKGSGYPECNHRVSIVTTSGATWYENVGSLDSRGAAEQEDPTVGDDSFEEDKSTLSYENLYADNEQDSDDYLNPESDNGSEPSEDYMVPISDPELPETTEAQIHYATALVHGSPRKDTLYAIPGRKRPSSFDSTENEYMNPELDAGSVHTDAQIHSAADTEVYEPMAGQIDSWQDRHSNGNDEDYEKMESSDYCNVHEVEMSEEDRRRMERCRAVFMNRLHLSSPHNTLADVVIALRNPR